MSRGLQVQLQESLRGANGPFQIDLDFHLLPGEWLGIYGPSGAGKTTLLRSIAGLHRPTKAQISFQGNRWQDGQQFLQSGKRSVGMVFQDQGLFPHLRLAKQIAFGLESNDQNAAKVAQWIQDLGLNGLEKTKMRHLSGGQRQRVALARTLITEPQVLLLDEPFQGLDEANLNTLLKHLQQVRNQGKTTAILVSHRKEILTQICHRVAAFKAGSLQMEKPLPPTPSMTILQLSEQGDHWELTYQQAEQTQQTRLPKNMFPYLKVGDRIQVYSEDQD